MDPCGICGQEGAEYVCSNCGRLVCRDCYVSEKRLCLQCVRRERLLGTPFEHRTNLMTAGTLLIFAGFFLVFLASILSVQSGEWTIILFPFIFTSGGGGWVVALMLVLFLVFMLLPWLMTWRRLRQP